MARNNWVSKVVLDSMKKIKKDMISNMSAYGRNATKRSIRSLRANVEYDSSGYHGVIEGSESWNFMERGSGPHSRPGSIYIVIYKWLVAKGISIPSNIRGKNSNSKRRRFAGAIANKIKKEGTSLHRRQGFDDIMTSSIEHHTEILAEMAANAIFKVSIETKFDK